MEAALGPEAAVSKSTVSRICAQIKEELDAWRHRDRSGIELDVLYLDGSHFRYHPGAKAEPVLCAGGLSSRARNLGAKVPAHAQDQVKGEFWAIFNHIEAEPGEPAVAEARARARRFSARWRKLSPGMVECFEEDQEARFAHLRLPKAAGPGADARTSSSGRLGRRAGESR